MKKSKTILAVVADEQGEVFEHPQLHMAGMNGMSPCLPQAQELIPLPEGSRLFTLPGVPPIGYDPGKQRFVTSTRLPRQWGGARIQAVCAFMAPAYTRTLLPAADYGRKQLVLPLWAYTAVGWCVEDERFYVAAARVDRNTQWQPEHFDDRELDPLVRNRLRAHPDNRLLEQLARCAVDYHCFAAKNLFFGRWEAPLPTSPACNSACLGCLSLQPEASECCPSSQERIAFVPTVDEICGVAVPHLEQAQNAIVSFGQGCEGDPILQADLIASAVRRMRGQTTRGTIHLNSNASLPDAVERLADAGLDSIRVSLNSVRPALYQAYHRPQGYVFADVVESLRRAKRQGLFTMLNYLVFPGVSDQPAEVEALLALLEETGVDLVQLRNLSIDPQVYWQAMGEKESGMGMKAMMDLVKQRLPHLQYGYFNRTRENFFPPGYETDWPL
ncbi:Radical SAM superfamily protein [Geoalkalibacter ferrihydriticus]|uniref:Radical SAM protein n=2 Tax=Geoalkalibacter ferrihydriticus TaxID=392333 RepID=A0A0C2HNE4_9BACT|nr:radical SAM protein [Geoalkalibacter ferrihydriticus]KIH76465.1 radical SAM protein [Geoalkalibacter ferrihydriticus DSM 17813]SDL96708.1 Radical SAM superfamily protein [Geoalkalibacter ferrihydriticus]